MKSWIRAVKNWLSPPQNGVVTYKHYVRTGECNQCGKCCSEIYLIHGSEIISTIAQFDHLKQKYKDYQNFMPQVEDETGVKFACKHLQEDNTCGIYDDRPSFCKKYPSEATLIHGGKLAAECGFAFEARYAFGDVLAKTSKKSSLFPGKLLNDVRAVLPQAPGEISHRG